MSHQRSRVLRSTRGPLSEAALLAGAGRALTEAGPGECWVTGTLSGWRTGHGGAEGAAPR
jgi:hypothetical protein